MLEILVTGTRVSVTVNEIIISLSCVDQSNNGDLPINRDYLNDQWPWTARCHFNFLAIEVVSTHTLQLIIIGREEITKLLCLCYLLQFLYQGPMLTKLPMYKSLRNHPKFYKTKCDELSKKENRNYGNLSLASVRLLSTNRKHSPCC